MKALNLERYKKKGKTTLEDYVQGFVEAYKKDVADKSSFLSFTLYDKFFDSRKKPLFGTEAYPFVHCKLEVLNKDLAEQVKNRFDIDYYELSLHMNTFSKMHNTYYSLSENSQLIRYFAESENSKVMFEDEPDFEEALKDANIIPSTDGIVTVKNILGNGGMICKKNNRGNLIPMRYLEIPSKPFFDCVYGEKGIEIVESDSADYYYYLGDKGDPKSVLRKYTTELVLSILKGNDREIKHKEREYDFHKW